MPLHRNGPYQAALDRVGRVEAGDRGGGRGVSAGDPGRDRVAGPGRTVRRRSGGGQLLAGACPPGTWPTAGGPARILIVSEAARALITAGLAIAPWLAAFSLPLLLVRPRCSAWAGGDQRRAAGAGPGGRAARTTDARADPGRGARQRGRLAGPPVAGALCGCGPSRTRRRSCSPPGRSRVAALRLLLRKGPSAGPGRAARPARAPRGTASVQKCPASVQECSAESWPCWAIRCCARCAADHGGEHRGVGLELIAVVILREQAVSSAMIGIALAAGAVGGLAGAPLVRPLHRIRPGVLLLAVCAVQAPVFTLLAVGSGPWWIGGPAVRRHARRALDPGPARRPDPAAGPEGERGRVVGAVMTLLGLGMPAGYAAAGLLLQFLRGPRRHADPGRALASACWVPRHSANSAGPVAQ